MPKNYLLAPTWGNTRNWRRISSKAARPAIPRRLRRCWKHHPRLRRLPESEFRSAPFALADAQLVIAREHGFESWPKFAKHIEAVAHKSSGVSKFESAVDAVITGDVAALGRLLRDNPELIRQRSTRVHQSTLLHYVSANGVEDFRQKTPKNAVEVAKFLLKAGAEVDAENNPGRGTTLRLVATSIHPKQAGVQIALLETLLESGASVDGAPGGWNPLTAALANGRPEAAEFLASRGARLDIEGAAGVGRLDLVRSFFNEDGGLKANATKAQMERGFLWACEYGRNSVVDFLLQKSVDLLAQGNTGETGLHWAVVGGQLDTIKLLLERGAPLEARNVYGGTALGQATWCVIHGDPMIDYVPIIETLINAGAKVEEADYPTGNERVDKVLRCHGAKS